MSFSHTSSTKFKSKKKRFRPKHQKAKLFRASEPLLSVLMWGVNHTVNELTHVNIPVMLMPDDFKAHTKVKVDNHLFNKENMPSHFKVKEYCPLVFRNLRERFGMDDQEYIASLTKHQARPLGTSPGKSGAKFYESYDHLLILKTLTSDEVENMHHLLKEYHPYIVERHGKTLLPQYLGMYRLTVEGSETYLVAMRNIFSSNLTIHKRYDLKGSTVEREASEKEKSKGNPVLKDNDFIKDGGRIYLDKDDRTRFLEMVQADSNFLARANIMDYSLCLGIHDVERAEKEALETDKTQASNPQGLSGDDEEGDSSGGDRNAEPNSDNVPVVPTPPESPTLGHKQSDASENDLPMGSSQPKTIDPARDIYAMKSSSDAPKEYIYFAGLIDVLTQFGLRKRTAQAAKSVKHGREAEISTVHPEQYAKRFQDFIAKAVGQEMPPIEPKTSTSSAQAAAMSP